MKKEPIDLSTVDAETLKLLLNDKNVLMRLEMNSDESGYKTGTVINIVPKYVAADVRVKYDSNEESVVLRLRRNDAGVWLTKSGSRKLVALRTVQMTTETAKPGHPPKPKEEFSDKGIMPSDHPGINEMLKKGFKEIFGGDMTGAKAPTKRTLPSSKALFIVASEKYLGLGFNDEQRL